MSDSPSVRADGAILAWPIVLAIALGIFIYVGVGSDVIAGLVGLIVGFMWVLANRRHFQTRWYPANLTSRQKSRFLWAIKLLLAGGGVALLAMAQLAPDLLYARWTPSTGWLTRSGGSNSHALITYFGSAVLGVALMLPFRTKVEP